MGKPTICIGENKGADQLRGNREADQRLCFRYSDSTIPLLLKSEISSLCACAAGFVLDLFENHIVGFPTRRLIYYILSSQACCLWITSVILLAHVRYREFFQLKK